MVRSAREGPPVRVGLLAPNLGPPDSLSGEDDDDTDVIVPSDKGALSTGLLGLEELGALLAAVSSHFSSTGSGLEDVGASSSFSCSIDATTAEAMADGGGFVSARGGSSWDEGAAGTLVFFSPSASGKSFLIGAATSTLVFSPSLLAGSAGGGGGLLEFSGSFSPSSRRPAPSPASRAISVDPASLSRAPSSGLLLSSQEPLDHRLNIEDLADGFSAPGSGDEASVGGVAVPENAFFLFSPAHCVQDEIYAVVFDGAFSTSGDAGAAEVAQPSARGTITTRR